MAYLNEIEIFRYHKFTRGSEATLEMWIPPRYVNSDYESDNYSVTVLEGGWISSRSYWRLDTTYDKKYWFDLLIADEVDPICPYCKEFTCEFSGKISRGYLQTCGSDECLTKMHSITMTEYVNSDSYLQACSHLSGFVNKGNSLDDLCYLYLAYSSEIHKYKFGVTNNIDHKRSYGLYVRPILSLKRSDISIVEFLLSNYFESEWLEDLKLFKKIFRYIINNKLYDQVTWSNNKPDWMKLVELDNLIRSIYPYG